MKKSTIIILIIAFIVSFTYVFLIPDKINLCVDEECRTEYVWIWSEIPIHQIDEPIEIIAYPNKSIEVIFSEGSDEWESYDLNCNNETGECTLSLKGRTHTIEFANDKNNNVSEGGK